MSHFPPVFYLLLERARGEELAKPSLERNVENAARNSKGHAMRIADTFLSARGPSTGLPVCHVIPSDDSNVRLTGQRAGIGGGDGGGGGGASAAGGGRCTEFRWTAFWSRQTQNGWPHGGPAFGTATTGEQSGWNTAVCIGRGSQFGNPEYLRIEHLWSPVHRLLLLGVDVVLARVLMPMK